MDNQLNVFIHVLEDDADMVFEIERLFEQAGLKKYKLFTSPEEFLKIVEKEPIQICIMDYLYEGFGITGYDLAKTVLEYNQKSKVIVISVQTDPKVFLKLYNVGVWKYLNKMEDDFNEDLIKWVKVAIDIFKKEVEDFGELKRMKFHDIESTH